MIKMIKKQYTLTQNFDRATVLLVGCGGTGSYAALHLAQLVYTSGLDIRLVFIDPDRVETKNVARQNFAPSEVGLPKAVALAHRYSFAYGLPITPVVERFRAEHLRCYEPDRDWFDASLTLIVGAVDNYLARRDIHRAVINTDSSPDRAVYWLDAGNDDRHGQIVIGNSTLARPVASKMGVVYGLPLPSVQEPGLLASPDSPRSKYVKEGMNASCAELVQAGVQSRTINKMMAAWLDVYAEMLLVSRRLTIQRTIIDQRSGQTWSEPIVEPLTARNQRLTVRARTELCPRCDLPVIYGRDVDDAGQVVEIVFCDGCDFRQTAEEWRGRIRLVEPRPPK